MRSSRRTLLVMFAFLVICLSVRLWAPSGDNSPAVGPATGQAPQPPVIVEAKMVEPTPEPVVTPVVRRTKTPAREAYYMTLFSSDGASNAARDSHTFATFARTKVDEDSDSVESHTISWMPASLIIAPLRGPETGRNMTLEETLEWAQSVGSRIAAWGPFEVKKEFYDRSKQQFDRLQRGEVMYKMLDVRFRPGQAINCIHAVCDVAPAEMLLTGTAYGEPVGWTVVNYFRPWLVNPAETHDWVTDHLGLWTYDINYRKLEPATPAANP